LLCPERGKGRMSLEGVSTPASKAMALAAA